jgi:hypothetical protein
MSHRTPKGEFSSASKRTTIKESNNLKSDRVLLLLHSTTQHRSVYENQKSAKDRQPTATKDEKRLVVMQTVATARPPIGTNSNNTMNITTAAARNTQQPRKPRQPPIKKQPQPRDDDVGQQQQQPIRRSTAGPSNFGGGNNDNKQNHRVVHKPNGPTATKQPQQKQQQKPLSTVRRLAGDESKSPERQSRTSGGSMSGSSLQGDIVAAVSSPSKPSSPRRAPVAGTAAVSPLQRSPVRQNLVMTMTAKSCNMYMNKPPASPMRKQPAAKASGDRSVNSLGNQSLGSNRSPAKGSGGSGGAGAGAGGAPLSPRRQTRRIVIDPSSNIVTSNDSTGNKAGPARSAAAMNSPGGKMRRPPVARVLGDTGSQSLPGAPIMPTAVSLQTPRRPSAAAVQREEPWAAFEPDQWPDTPMSTSCSGTGGASGSGGGGGVIPTTSSSDDGDSRQNPPLARRKQRRPPMPQQHVTGEKSSPVTVSPRATTSLKAKLEIAGGFRPSQYFNSNIEGVCSVGEPSLSLEKAASKSPKSYKQGLAGRHDSLMSSWGNISAMEKKERADGSSTGPPATAATASINNNKNNTSTPGNPNGVYIMPTKQTKLYEYARNCQWDDVTRELRENPRDAKCVGEKDGTTALHLAVMSRSNPNLRDGKMGEEYQSAPLSLIEQLIQAAPEAAIIRCARKRYTPLSYACLVADRGYSMDDAAEMVEILLKHAPDSAFVFTDDGFSALDVHILSYSRFHKQKEEVYSGGRTSTVVLRTLLAQQPSLAKARVYRNKIRGPIELLYRCNTEEFRDALEEETGLVDDAVLIAKKQKQRFGSVMSVLTDWWAWKWALVLLKFASLPGQKAGTMFQAVHAAARMVGCPLPIIALAVNTFPLQVTERDPRNDLYNVCHP